MVMPASDPDQALNLLGVRPRRVVVLRDVPLGNGNWLVETAAAERFVLRRYHPQATREDLAYEHAVLGYLAGLGWVVPARAGRARLLAGPVVLPDPVRAGRGGPGRGCGAAPTARP